MTPAQHRLYWGAWKKAWEGLVKGGHWKATEEERARKNFHVAIGAVYWKGAMAGEAKSSRFLNNADLDAFLKRCEACKWEGSLTRMMELDAMPEKRALWACKGMLDAVGMEEAKRAGYVAGIYRNVQRGRERVLELHEMRDGDLQLVLVSLRHTVAHKLGVAHGHPESGWVSGGKARSAVTHKVGARRKKGAVGDEGVRPARGSYYGMGNGLGVSEGEGVVEEGDGNPF